LAFAVAPPESAEYYASRNASLDSGEVMLTYGRNRLMNAYSRIGVGLGMLASAALGGLTVEQVHAQAKPPVYFVERDRCE
jgi:hypothetical protein